MPSMQENQTRILKWHSQTQDDRECSLDLPALSEKEHSWTDVELSWFHPFKPSVY